MGVSNSSENLQEKTNKKFRGFEFIQVYINDLLIITKGNCFYHVEKLELTLKNLKNNRTKCNIKKLFFGKIDMQYLGFWVTQNGIRPINKKV